MSKFWSEFKEFIMRGNVVDMAVGVVVGAAFKGIVDSLVNDIIMPPIGYLLGGVDFCSLKVVMKQAIGAPGAEGYVPEVAINYGMSINSVISFLIIALVIFSIVKSLQKVKTALIHEQVEEEKEEEPQGPTETELLQAILEEVQKNKHESV